MAKPPPKAKKLVWRVSPEAPNGEWVDPTRDRPKPERPKLDEPEVSSGSWITSSFDLLNGTDVVERSGAISDEAFDKLFKPPGGPKKPAP